MDFFRSSLVLLVDVWNIDERHEDTLRNSSYYIFSSSSFIFLILLSLWSSKNLGKNYEDIILILLIQWNLMGIEHQLKIAEIYGENYLSWTYYKTQRFDESFWQDGLWKVPYIIHHSYCSTSWKRRMKRFCWEWN